jgi:hypothetical protein
MHSIDWSCSVDICVELCPERGRRRSLRVQQVDFDFNCPPRGTGIKHVVDVSKFITIHVL